MLPWVDLGQAQWATLPINRAEPAQSGLVRPDTAFLTAVHNVLVSWPTKLALAPDLSDQVLAELAHQKLQPTLPQPESTLPVPPVAIPVWETCFP